MLSRLALRLAAVNALNGADKVVSGPWPTIAGSRVFDSRQDPYDALDDIDTRPLLIIYTEQSESAPYEHNRSRPDNIEVYLTVEAMVAARGQVQTELPDGTLTSVGSLDVPITDQKHEAMLDVLEAVVTRRLRGEVDIDAATQLFRRVAFEIRHVHSVPIRDATRTVRLAGRTITYRCKVGVDQWPKPDFTSPSLAAPDHVPDPLGLVLKNLPAGSASADTAALAASLLSSTSALTRLDLATLSSTFAGASEKIVAQIITGT